MFEKRRYTENNQSWVELEDSKGNVYNCRVAVDADGVDEFIGSDTLLQDVINEDGEYNEDMPTAEEVDNYICFYVDNEDLYRSDDWELQRILAQDCPDVFA